MPLLFAWRGNYGNGVACCRLIVVSANEHYPDSLTFGAALSPGQASTRRSCFSWDAQLSLCLYGSAGVVAFIRQPVVEQSVQFQMGSEAFRVLQPWWHVALSCSTS